MLGYWLDLAWLNICLKYFLSALIHGLTIIDAIILKWELTSPSWSWQHQWGPRWWGCCRGWSGPDHSCTLQSRCFQPSCRALSPVTWLASLLTLRHLYLFAFGLFSPTYREELWPGLVVSSCVQASQAGRGWWPLGDAMAMAGTNLLCWSRSLTQKNTRHISALLADFRGVFLDIIW